MDSTSSFHLLPGIVCYLSLDGLAVVLGVFFPLTACQASRWKEWYFASFSPCSVWPADIACV